MTPGHWLGLGFILYAGASVLWSPSSMDGIHGMWKLLLLTGAFILGAASEPRHAVAGFAAGLSLSGFLALAEFLGWLTLEGGIGPRGLLGMKNYLAEAGLIALVGALAYRMWWAMPGCLIAACLPLSKGVLLAMAVLILIWLWTRKRKWPAALATGGFLALCMLVAGFLVAGDPALHTAFERWEIWRQTVNGLTWLGHGWGSYFAAFPGFQSGAPQEIYGWTGVPGQAHNDPLQVVSETGLASALFLAVAIYGLRAQTPARWPFAAFLLAGLAAFPLFNPATGIMGALLAGGLYRAGHDLRLRLRAGRDDLHPGLRADGSIQHRPGPIARGRGVPAFGADQGSQRGVPVAAGWPAPESRVGADPAGLAGSPR